MGKNRRNYNNAHEALNFFAQFDTGILKLKLNEDGTGMILLIDMDDLLINMSDIQQEMIDQYEFKNGVRFKTNVIKMLEQQIRNCEYLLNEVEKECEAAKRDNRAPNLARFPIFKNYVFNPKSIIRYDEPVAIVKRYLKDAKTLYGQYFEERDTFLEIDNLPKGQKLKFNLKKEHSTIEKCRKLIMKDKVAFEEINKFCLNEGKRKINEAKQKGDLVNPEFGKLISMDNNDVLKKNELNIKNTEEVAKYKEHALYEKPLELLENCVNEQDHIWDIVSNEAVFTMASEEVVDFKKIYDIMSDRVNGDAVEFVKALIESGYFVGAFIDTHYNGYREGYYKIELAKQLLPEVNGIICQMFHDHKHNGKKRIRSSKVGGAIKQLRKYYGAKLIDALRILLVDDSTPNMKDCNEKGALGVQFKPFTDSEIINEKNEETGDGKYFRITKFCKEAFVMTCMMIQGRMEQLYNDGCDKYEYNGKIYKKQMEVTLSDNRFVA